MSEVEQNHGYEEYWLQRRLQDIPDDRLKRLICETWYRLPKADRQKILDSCVVLVQDDEMSEDGEKSGVIELLGGKYTPRIRLNPSVSPDDACIYVIAHEFAHALLHHPEMKLFATGPTYEGVSYTPYSLVEHAALEWWIEEHAIMCVILWGFKDEIKVYFDAYPEAYRPRIVDWLYKFAWDAGV